MEPEEPIDAVLGCALPFMGACFLITGLRTSYHNSLMDFLVFECLIMAGTEAQKHQTVKRNIQ